MRYHSSDASAPTLSGQVGAWIPVLDAVLVGTAGIAYGAKAAAGWTKEYTGTNVAVYRNSLANGGTGCYLRVDDTNAQYARVIVYASMSDINTGTDPTPATGQISGGAYWHKSNAASSATREWCIVADSLTLYGVNMTNQLLHSTSTTRNSALFGAGDFATIQPSDSFRYFCIGGHNSTSAGAQSSIQQNPSYSSSAFSTYYGVTVGRPYTSSGTSAIVGIGGSVMGGGGSGTAGSSTIPFSMTGSGVAICTPALVNEGVCIARGRWRGAYTLLNAGSQLGIGNLVASLTDPLGAQLVELTIYNGNGTMNGCILVSSGTLG